MTTRRPTSAGLVQLLRVFRWDRKARIFDVAQAVQAQQLSRSEQLVLLALQVQVAQVKRRLIWFVVVAQVRVLEEEAAPLGATGALPFVEEEEAAFWAAVQLWAQAEASRLDALPSSAMALQLVAAQVAAKLVAELAVPPEAKRANLGARCVAELPKVWGWRQDVVRPWARLCPAVVAS
jgi:hypothetical protein